MYSKNEVQVLKKEFWESFSNYSKFYSKKVGESIEWIRYETGVKGIELKFDLENKITRVVLEVNAKSDDKKFDIYVELDKYRNIIQANFEQKLIWDEDFKLPEGKMVSRIYTELDGLSFYNTDNWPKIFKFMAENMFLLQTNYLEIKPILEEKFGS